MKPRSLILVLTLVLTAASAMCPIDDIEAELLATAEAADTATDEAVEPLTDPLIVEGWLRAVAALGSRHPWLWKLSLLPLHWLLVRGIYQLLLRFTTRHRALLTAGVVLSPAVLPVAGLGGELAELALGITALLLFISAVEREPADRRAPLRALAGGAVVGLSALCYPVAAAALCPIVAYGVIYRRARWAWLAAATAALAWPICHLLLGGPLDRTLAGVAQSLPAQSLPIQSLPATALAAAAALLAVLGAGLAGTTLLPLAGLRGGPALATGAALGLAATIGGIAFRPIAAVVFWALGAASVVAVTISLLRLVRGQSRLLEIGHRRMWRFLGVWLVCAAIDAFARRALDLTPSDAGLALVATLVVARALTMSYHSPSAVAVRVAVVVGASLGIGLWSLELYSASVARAAARLSAERIVGGAGQGDAWYDAGGGFGFYAAARGLRPIVDERTIIDRGDHVVVAARSGSPALAASDGGLDFLGRLLWDDRLRLAVGDRRRDGVVVRHRSKPRYEVELYAAQREVVLHRATGAPAAEDSP